MSTFGRFFLILGNILLAYNSSLSVLRKMMLILFSLFFLAVSSTAFALPFEIIPKTGTQLPTSVNAGSTVTAYYTVINRTGSARNNNFVKFLPPNVAQVKADGVYGDTCGPTFNLAKYGQAGSSCTLQLTVSGPVNQDDPLQQNHLFVCFPGGITCAGTNYPLNVNQASQKQLVSIAISASSNSVNTGSSLQFQATGKFADGSQQNLTNTSTWASSAPAHATISATGLATGISSGSAVITASFAGLSSNSFTLTVTYASPLVSIVVSPATVFSSNGGTQQYTAIGHFADSSTQNISSTVTWVSSNTGTATINSAGLATGVGAGSTNIIATSSSISSNSVTFQIANFIYFANLTNGSISYCALSPSGNLITPCTVTSASPDNPQGVALNTKAAFAYITQNLTPGPSPVIYCPINSDGSFGACANSTTLFINTNNLMVNSPGTFLYVSGGGTITFCSINADGSLSNCGPTGSVTGFPEGVTVNSQNTFAYVTDSFSGSILSCPINADGTFGTCTTSGTGIGNLSYPAINSAGTNLYVVSDDNNVYVCPTDPTDGIVGTCVAAGNFPNGPLGVGINPANTISYVTDSNNEVSVCPINSDGTFGTCTVQTDSTLGDTKGVAVGF